LIQSFLIYFTTEELLAPALFEQNPEVVPLTLNLVSLLESLLLRPRFLAPHPQAVLRALLFRFRPILDSVDAMKEEEPTDYIAMELLEKPNTPLLKVLRLDVVQKASESIQASLLAWMLALSILPHTLPAWTVLHLLALSSDTSKPGEDFIAEAKKSVDIEQDEGIRGYMPPVRVKVDESKLGVFNKAFEDMTKRYARGWDEFTAEESFTLPGEDSNDPNYYIPEGSSVLAAYWLREGSSTSERDGSNIEKVLQECKCCNLKYQSHQALTLHSQWDCFSFNLCHHI
jgi:hypothetical protein